MDYRRNEDKWGCNASAKPLYNAVLDVSLGVGGTEVVTLAEAKTHLLIDTLNTDHDIYLATLIRQATTSMEKYTGRSIVRKEITATLRNQLGDIEIPYGYAVTIIEAKDIEGNIIDSTSYKIRGFQTKWLETKFDYIQLTYEAGYEFDVDPEEIYFMADMKQAILCEIAWRFEHRGDEVNIGGLCPMAKGIAAQYRRQTWLA